MINFREKDECLIFTVRVIPRAAKSEIVGEHDGALKVRLAAPPADGAANEELIKLLAKGLSVAKSEVEILSGHASKIKQIAVKSGSAKLLSSF